MSKNYGKGYDDNGRPMSPEITTNPPSWSFPCDKAECGLCNAGLGHSQEQGRTPR